MKEHIVVLNKCMFSVLDELYLRLLKKPADVISELLSVVFENSWIMYKVSTGQKLTNFV